jgi:hypothetical protein
MNSTSIHSVTKIQKVDVYRNGGDTGWIQLDLISKNKYTQECNETDIVLFTDDLLDLVEQLQTKLNRQVQTLREFDRERSYEEED